MKNPISLFLFLFVFCVSIVSSQTDDNGAAYFPLRVGNAFYYITKHSESGVNYNSFVVSRITNTKVINGNSYYYCTNFCGTPQNYYLRYDGTTGNIVKYDSLNSSCNYEFALFCLSSNVGDSISTSCGNNTYKCLWVNDTTIFGVSTRRKFFIYGYNNWGNHFEYNFHFSRNLGCTGNTYSEIGSYYSFITNYTLQGCIINGVVSGDTVNHIVSAYADSGRYMPLAIGNKWVYLVSHDPPPSSYKKSVIITKDTIANNRRYYMAKGIFSIYDSTWVRFDEYSGRLVSLSTSMCNNDFEYMMFNLAANKGDSNNLIPCCRSYLDKCAFILDSTLLGHTSKLKGFGYSYMGHYASSTYYYFAKDLGMYYFCSSYSGNVHEYNSQKLLGCYINGVLYGDTTSVTQPSYADSGKYMPLEIGNKWVYLRTYKSEIQDGDTAYKVVSKITKDTTIDGYRYFYVERFSGPSPSYWVRYDTTTGRLIKKMVYSFCNGNFTMYNFAYAIGDSSRMDTCSDNPYRVTKIYDSTLFGLYTRTKEYSWQSSYIHASYYQETEFAKNLGPSYYKSIDNTISVYTEDTYRLTGCVINGVVYGDTSTVVKQVYADSAKYFPVEIGNRWVFDVWRYPAAGWIKEAYSIKSDTMINNKEYFYLEGFPPYPHNSSYSWVSYDTTSGIFKLQPITFGMNDDYVKLSSVVGESMNYTCERIADTTIFNLQTRRKYFDYSWSGYHTFITRNLELIKDIGPIFYKYTISALKGYEEVTCVLRGCVINGVVYGDTSLILTGINSVSNSIPDKYALHQNYPNPFNPSTIIRFQIKDSRFVTLKVYDILGKEIATLVNEKQSPGTYEVKFDGSGLSSGMYFYKLEAGDFKEVKKMLMLK